MKHYLEDYPYGGLTGEKYYPYFDDVKQKWQLINDNMNFTIIEIACLCNIPVDEVVMLTLKYGQ